MTPDASPQPRPSWRLLAALGLILLCALALRVYHLDAQSLWWDEALSLRLALAPGIEWRPIDAGHPPLYDYAVLKPWTWTTGSTEFAARYLSVVFGVLAVALAFHLARLLYNDRTGLVAALLVSLSAILVWYAQEVRMYTLVACQILLLLILLHHLLRRPDHRFWPLFAALSVLEWAAVYTQYLAAVVVAWVNVVALTALLTRKEWPAARRWLAAQALALVLALPLVPAALGQVGGYVPPNATPLDLGAFAVQVWGGYLGGTLSLVGHHDVFDALAIAAAVALGLGAALLLLFSPTRGRDLLLLSYTLVPLAAIFVIMALRPGFHPRYVVMLAAPLLVFAARVVVFLARPPFPRHAPYVQRGLGPERPSLSAGIRFEARGRLEAGWLIFSRWATPTLSLATLGTLAAAFVVAVVAVATTPDLQRDDVRRLARRLAAQATPADAVLLDYVDYAFDHYYHGPAPATSLNLWDSGASDASIVERVAQATQGRQRVFTVNWTHAHADQRGLLPWLLQTAGRRVGQWGVSSLSVDEYRLDGPVQFPTLASANVNFGPLALTGVGIAPGAQADGAVSVALRWRATGAAPPTKAAVSLLDRQGRLIASADKPVADGQGRPASAWEPGTEVLNVYTLLLPPGTPPVDYDVAVAVYDAATLRPLDVRDAQGAPAGTRVVVAPVQVPRALGVVPPDPSLTPLNASPADGLRLEGAAVEPREAAPGQKLRARLRWRATRAAPDAGLIRLQLVRDDRVIAETSGAPADGAYPTTRWVDGEVVLDRRDVVIPAGTTSGAVTLQVRVGDGAPVKLADVTVTGASHSFDAPQPQFPLAVDLGVARLIGYDLPKQTVTTNEALPLTLYWQAGTPGPASLTVFTHLLDASGRLIAQHDSPPANGSRPTSGWVSGEMVTDAHALVFSDNGYSGSAVIEVGLYDPVSGARVPTPDGSGRILLPTRVTISGRSAQ